MQPVDSRLVTPEAVVLRFETSGLGSRFLARSLDLLVQFGALLGLLFVAAAADRGGGGSTALVIVYLFAVFAIIFVYPAAMETLWRGRTLGKAALGLRVVTREGAPIRFRHAAIRSALFVVDGLLLGPSVGVLALLISRDNQRVGDIVAGTLVVRERSGARPPMPAAFAVPPGCEPYVDSLDTSGLRSEDYEVVRALLLRAHSFAPAIRYDLARQVGTHVATRLRHTPPEWAHPELYLSCVAAAYQRRYAAPSPAMAAWAPPVPSSVAAASPSGPAPGGDWGAAPARPPVATEERRPTDGFAPPG
jgi:uncharacterized RDD family membrane protein YckC